MTTNPEVTMTLEELRGRAELTVAGMARLKGVSTMTIRRAIHTRGAPHYYVAGGSHIRIPVAAWERWERAGKDAGRRMKDEAGFAVPAARRGELRETLGRIAA